MRGWITGIMITGCIGQASASSVCPTGVCSQVGMDTNGVVSATTFYGNTGSFGNVNATGTITGTVASVSTLYVAGGQVTSAASGLPSGAIVAFASTICPTGWSEYIAARGMFLRGIDNGAGYDPSGTRTPSSYQADVLASHAHTIASRYGASAWSGSGVAATDMGGSYIGTLSSATGGAETRPKNIAVLFCQKD